MGDYVEVGCNSVLCPGTIIGPHTNVYPLSRVRGQIAANSILKMNTCNFKRLILRTCNFTSSFSYVKV